jgi:hypothetical protein
MTGRGAGYCGGLGRGRQHAAAPILHGLEVSFPKINISNKRGPAPQGGRGRGRGFGFRRRMWGPYSEKDEAEMLRQEEQAQKQKESK